jgi:hypothetical protein
MWERTPCAAASRRHGKQASNDAALNRIGIHEFLM